MITVVPPPAVSSISTVPCMAWTNPRATAGLVDLGGGGQLVGPDNRLAGLHEGGGHGEERRDEQEVDNVSHRGRVLYGVC
jgi:hypothetical protein